MKANTISVLDLFERKMQLEVPLFQRPYVWSKEQQWEPFWEDISSKFNDYLGERREEAPAHFFGALVLDQKLTPLTYVERRQVIDGQQRLTTLQLFLAAFRDFCREQSCEELAKEFEGFTLNQGKMARPEVEKFKVWPTQADHDQFSDVMSLGSREAINRKYPVHRQKYAREDNPRPRMVEAYIYFGDRLSEYFLGAETPAGASDRPLSDRIDDCFQALKNALKVVAIDLEKDDDPQVIFETLNARGEPLLPADLLRNYIFLRATRASEPTEELYQKYWRSFEDEFWRTEVRQGRLSRPRSDLFMQHFLASRKMTEIPIKHLFVEYKNWIEREKPTPFGNIRDEITTLARQRDDFRRIIEPQKHDPLAPFVSFLDQFELRTVYPLLLFLLDVGMTDTNLVRSASILESYLLRRAVLGWHTKNYSRIFLTLTKSLRSSAPTPENLETALLTFKGDSFAWPTDVEFQKAWLNGNAYAELKHAKLVHILGRLSEAMRDKRTEVLTINSELSVEHIMPQSWISNWPLASGERGREPKDMQNAPPADARTMATVTRNAAVHTMGNLTLVTQPLNSTNSNSAWAVKKEAILKASLLPINLDLRTAESWDEVAIQERGKRLFQLALRVWPRPKVSEASP